jgi:hypothetical protein
MRHILASLLFIASGVLFGQTEDRQPNTYYLLLGKMHSILSEQGITSQQLFCGKQLIWMNARLGRVERPKGMTRDTEIVTEMVPNDDGISIAVGRPFDPDKVQGFPIPFHSIKKREFLFLVPIQDHTFTDVSGSYGGSFSEQALTAIFDLAPSPPPPPMDHMNK